MLLVELGSFFEDVPAQVVEDEQDSVVNLDEILERMEQWRAVEQEGPENEPVASRNRPPEIIQLAEDLAELLRLYLEYVSLLCTCLRQLMANLAG